MRTLRLRARVGVFGAILALLFAAAPAAAQVDTGTILGTVKDQSGGVLPGATVTITHEGQGFTLSAVTREDGTFIFTPVRTGAYTVRVEFPGFRKTEQRSIGVSIQQNATVDFTLEPGNLTEDVVVTASAALLETGTGTVGQTLGSSTIENLPINGRDYTILARLSPGVVPPQPGARAPLMFSANGVRPAQNNYMLDGIDNNTSNVDFLSGVAYIVKPPVDAVDEIKILTSSFSAEYGRAGGAVLNTTLKSGSNQFRGSLWEFARDDALNATDFFANRAGLKKGKYVSNQFGMTAGGPIVGRQDVLLRRLRRQPDLVGAHLGHDRADRGAAEQRLHQLLGSDLAAERQRRHRHPRPHVRARHGVRSGDDSPARRRSDRSGHGHGGDARRLRARSPSPATRSRPADSMPTPCG